DLAGYGNDLALLGRHFERRSLRDDGLSSFVVKLLVYANHPYIVQHGLGGRMMFGVRFAAAVVRERMGDQDVNLISGEHETRDAGGVRYGHRDSAHART